MNIYVASSWRNLLQPAVVSLLRRAGHEVYDFRNPAPGESGFAWSQIDPNWKSWTPNQYRDALTHPIAQKGFEYDIEALKTCDTCVLVLPSGRSASWEFGYAMGQGKTGAIVMFEECEPELMYSGNQILTNMNELMDWAGFPITKNYKVEYTDEQSGLSHRGSIIIKAPSREEAAQKAGGDYPGFYIDKITEVPITHP